MRQKVSKGVKFATNQNLIHTESLLLWFLTHFVLLVRIHVRVLSLILPWSFCTMCYLKHLEYINYGTKCTIHRLKCKKSNNTTFCRKHTIPDPFSIITWSTGEEGEEQGIPASRSSPC